MASDVEEEYVVDLKKLITMVFGYYRLFLLSMVVCASVLAGVNAWKSKYHVEGFFAFDDISFPAYKKYMTEILDATRLTAYLNERGLSEMPGVGKLYYAMADTLEFDRMIEPVFAYTKNDIKKFGIERYTQQAQPQAQQQSSSQMQVDPTGVIGIAMHFKGDDAETEKKLMTLMTDLITDRMMYLDISTMVHERAGKVQTNVLGLEQGLIKRGIDRAETLQRIADLKRLLKAYPDAAKFDSRQVVSVDNNGARYLSPLAQVVAVETQLTDIDFSIAAYKRDLEMARTYLAFYARVKEQLAKNATSEKLLPATKKIADAIMKEQASNETIRLSISAVYQEMVNIRTRYKERFRFSSGPTSPETKAGKFPLTDALGFGALAGFFATLLIVLTRLWWFELLPQKRVQIPKGG